MGRIAQTFNVCEAMVGAIEMASYRFVNILVSGRTKMFSKPVGEAPVSFTDIKFKTFIICDTINDITRYTSPFPCFSQVRGILGTYYKNGAVFLNIIQYPGCLRFTNT